MYDTIPNTYPKELLKEAYKKYKSLQADKSYKQCYRNIIGLLALQKDMLLQSDQAEPIQRAIDVLFEIALKRWKLNCLISPFLRIKEADLYKPAIKMTSPIIEFIYAYGISKDVAMYLPKIETNNSVWYSALFPKERRAKNKEDWKRDEELARYIFYFLTKELKAKQSFLIRLLNVSKESMRTYIKEGERFDKEKKEDLMQELLTGKRNKNKDALNASPQENKLMISEGLMRKHKKEIKTWNAKMRKNPELEVSVGQLKYKKYANPWDCEPIDNVKHKLTSEGRLYETGKTLKRNSDPEESE
jgi:hypothetical protein